MPTAKFFIGEINKGGQRNGHAPFSPRNRESYPNHFRTSLICDPTALPQLRKSFAVVHGLDLLLFRLLHIQDARSQDMPMHHKIALACKGKNTPAYYYSNIKQPTFASINPMDKFGGDHYTRQLGGGLLPTYSLASLQVDFRLTVALPSSCSPQMETI